MTTLKPLIVGGRTIRKFCTLFPKREAFVYHGYMIYSKFIFEILQTTHPSESKNQPRIRIFLYLLYHKSNRKDNKQKTKKTERIKNYKKQNQQNKKYKQIGD
jgi:hypothetical protein